MKRLLTAALSAACIVAANAETWTLDECIAYAVDHNITVRLSDVSRQSAELSVGEAKAGYLPSLSANAGQSWNLGRGLTAQNTYADRNTSSFNWGASLNVPIFNGMATPRRVAYAKANLLQVTEQYEAAKDDITINVITAYLQALYAKEMHAVALNQVELSEYELTRQQALLDAGKIPEVDLLEAQSTLAGDRLNVVTTQNDVVMALIDLAQLLQLDSFEGFDIMPLGDDNPMIISAEDAYNRALQHNHTIRAARLGVDVADKNIAVARSGYLPTLSGNAGVGSSYYKISGMDNEGFGRQMRNNYSSYFGLSLQIPIFDGLNTHNSVKRAKVQRLNAELQLDQAEQQLLRTIQQAYYQAVGAREKLASCQAAETAANAAFDAMREKYAIGRATPTEYEQSKNNALRATADRLQASYELSLRTRLLLFYAAE